MNQNSKVETRILNSSYKFDPQLKILAINIIKYCRVELEGQSCFQMKKWLSEKNSIESIAMPVQCQVQVHTIILIQNQNCLTNIFGISSANLIVTGFECWIHTYILIEYFFESFFQLLKTEQKKSLVNRFFDQTWKIFSLWHSWILLGNYHETCFQYSTFKLRCKKIGWWDD